MGRGAACVAGSGAESLLFGRRQGHASLGRHHSEEAPLISAHPDASAQGLSDRLIDGFQTGHVQPLYETLARYNDAVPHEHPLLAEMTEAVATRLNGMITRDPPLSTITNQPALGYQAVVTTTPLWHIIDRMLADDDSCQLFDPLAAPLVQATVANADPHDIQALVKCLSEHRASHSSWMRNALTAFDAIDPNEQIASDNVRWQLLQTAPESPVFNKIAQQLAERFSAGECSLSSDQIEKLVTDPENRWQTALYRGVARSEKSLPVGVSQLLSQPGPPALVPGVEKLRRQAISRLDSYQPAAEQAQLLREELVGFGLDEHVFAKQLQQWESSEQDKRQQLAESLAHGNSDPELSYRSQIHYRVQALFTDFFKRGKLDNQAFAYMVGDAQWAKIAPQLKRRLLPDRQLASLMNDNDWEQIMSRRWDWEKGQLVRGDVSNYLLLCIQASGD